MSDDTEKTDDVVDEDATTTEEDVVDEWKPPTKEEWEKAQASAKTARTEAANRRKWLKEHGIDPHSGKKIKSEVDAEKEDETASKVAAIEAKARRSLAAAVRGALIGSGANRDAADLLIGKIKFDDLDVDDDGSIEGLDDQLDSLKERYARLFEADEPVVKRTKTIGGTVRKENVKKEKSFSELLKEAAGL